MVTSALPLPELLQSLGALRAIPKVCVPEAPECAVARLACACERVDEPKYVSFWENIKRGRPAEPRHRGDPPRRLEGQHVLSLGQTARARSQMPTNSTIL
jgi:hypothetical protein